jgi:hypothetical protein
MSLPVVLHFLRKHLAAGGAKAPGEFPMKQGRRIGTPGCFKQDASVLVHEKAKSQNTATHGPAQATAPAQALREPGGQTFGHVPPQSSSKPFVQRTEYGLAALELPREEEIPRLGFDKAHQSLCLQFRPRLFGPSLFDLIDHLSPVRLIPYFTFSTV